MIVSINYWVGNKKWEVSCFNSYLFMHVREAGMHPQQFEQRRRGGDHAAAPLAPRRAARAPQAPPPAPPLQLVDGLVHCATHFTLL